MNLIRNLPDALAKLIRSAVVAVSALAALPVPAQDAPQMDLPRVKLTAGIFQINA